MAILPSDRKAAVDELINGREFAVQLGILVGKAWPDDSLAARELVDGVMSSFSRALDVLDTNTELKIDNGCKKRKNSGASRGAFTRRKQASQSRIVVSETASDEYSWRKYGQKQIQGSKFARSYFRCTHKHDQGCQATKQVQKSEEDPSQYILTYMGEHTCKDLNATPNLITSSNTSEPSMISFGSNISNVTQEFSLQSFLQVSKSQGGDDEVLSILKPSFPCSEFFDLPDLEPLMNETTLLHGGEGSGLQASPGSWDMSFMLDQLNFQEDMFIRD